MKKSIVFTCIISLFSCSEQKEKGSILEQDVFTENITSLYIEADFPKESIGKPEFILSIGDYIVLSASASDITTTIYNTKTGSIQNIGRKGRGPGELLSVNQIGIYPITDRIAFYVHDILAKKLLIYALSNEEFELWKTEDMSDFWTFDFDDSITIGVSAETESRYMLVDSLRNIQKTFGDYSEYGVGMREGALLYQGLSITNDREDRCAWFSYFGEALNIIDYGNPDDITIPYRKIYMDIVRGASLGALSPDSKYGFMSLTGNDKYIITLCCEKTLKDGSNSEIDPYNSNHLCVFNWDGEYVKHLINDQMIKCINISEQHNELYAVVLDDDLLYKVVSFPLDAIL